MPSAFKVYAILFLYATIFLGELKHYYTKYPWWDNMLHGSSALFFGLIGFTIMYLLYETGEIKANSKTIAIFTFAFALSIGALWEIVEFTIDQITNSSHWQGVGLFDTMKDLIVDSCGALLSSILGYLYLKREEKGKGEGTIVKPMMKEFKKDNPKLFKKK